MLKVAWVGIWLRMEFHAEDQWVITSRVQAITVQPERALPGPFQVRAGCAVERV